jgi:hypothetical protein
MAHADSPSVSFVDAPWHARGAPRMFVGGDLFEAALIFALALGGTAVVRRRLGL